MPHQVVPPGRLTFEIIVVAEEQVVIVVTPDHVWMKAAPGGFNQIELGYADCEVAASCPIWRNPRIFDNLVRWSDGGVVMAEPGPKSSLPREAGWKLQDAKARFSEVVRRAQNEGPQRVTIRGRDAVVVIAADDLDRLLPQTSDALPFVSFMEGLSVDGLDLERDRDLGRDPVL